MFGGKTLFIVPYERQNTSCGQNVDFQYVELFGTYKTTEVLHFVQRPMFSGAQSFDNFICSILLGPVTKGRSF
jgi:hypothetical protein